MFQFSILSLWDEASAILPYNMVTSTIYLSDICTVKGNPLVFYILNNIIPNIILV